MISTYPTFMEYLASVVGCMPFKRLSVGDPVMWAGLQEMPLKRQLLYALGGYGLLCFPLSLAIVLHYCG